MAKKLVDKDGQRKHDAALSKAGIPLGFRLHEPAEAECYFCDRVDVVDSKEHIIGQWSHELLDLRGKAFTPVYGNASGEVHHRGTIPAISLVSKGICTECNNSWMSELEGNMATFIREEEKSTITLDKIARWFIKTAFVLNVTQNTRLLVPRTVRLALANGKIDPRVSLFFHYAPDATGAEADLRVNWVQGAHLPPIYYDKSKKEAVQKSFKEIWACSIRLDNLVGTVVLSLPGELYSSSWENMGRAAILEGKIKHGVTFQDLPVLSHWMNAIWLMPLRTHWSDDDGTIYLVDDFPGFISLEEAEQYMMKFIKTEGAEYIYDGDGILEI